MARGGNTVAEPTQYADVSAFFADSGQVFRLRLIQAIRDLPDTEQFVMCLYYQHDLNMKEVAAVLGVTESRVCQIKCAAIHRLRDSLMTWAAA